MARLAHVIVVALLQDPPILSPFFAGCHLWGPQYPGVHILVPLCDLKQVHGCDRKHVHRLTAPGIHPMLRSLATRRGKKSMNYRLSERDSFPKHATHRESIFR